MSNNIHTPARLRTTVMKSNAQQYLRVSKFAVSLSVTNETYSKGKRRLPTDQAVYREQRVWKEYVIK